MVYHMITPFVLAAACAVAQPAFEPLGPPPGGWGKGLGISNDGSVVVGSQSVLNPEQAGGAWVWRPGLGYRFLPPGPGDPAAGALAISGDGRRIVGVTNDPYLPSAFAASWDSGTRQITVLGDLPGNEDGAVAFGVSRDGRYVVGTGSSDLGGSEAFLVGPDGVMRGLGFMPGGNWSEGLAVSADGNVVVGMAYLGIVNFEPMCWDVELGMFSLGILPNSYGGYANAVSDDGQVAVGVCQVDDPVRNNIFDHAFRWSWAEGLSELMPIPPYVGASALCTNSDGSAVGGSLFDDINFDYAMLWRPEAGCRLLSDVLIEAGLGQRIQGWDLVEVTAMSSDGTWLLGNGYAPGAGYQPFRVHLPQQAACEPDYNADGVADQEDVACLIATVAGDGSCTGVDPDFNRDGIADQDDVAALIDVIAGGGCP